MIWIFIASLFGTFVVTRIFVYLFHDRKNYGTYKEKSKTMTGIIRKMTGFDIHHFHFGILIGAMAFILFLFYGANKYLIILAGISLSFILDQLTPICNSKFNYFDKRRILEAFLLHILAVLISIRIF